MSIIQTLDEAAAMHPALRRYRDQGFTLVRPVIALELELGFDIESTNQILRVSASGTSVMSVSRNPA
jgi:hypothetical protein